MLSASSCVIRLAWMVTPILPRVTLPVRSCGSSSRTRLIGTAKPMPMLAMRLLRIAVLMPMTSPRTFRSGPPELPGLIAASVCSMLTLRCGATLNGRLRPLITPTVTVWL